MVGGRLLEGGRLLNIFSLRRGVYSKGSAYLKLGANSSIYSTPIHELRVMESIALTVGRTQLNFPTLGSLTVKFIEAKRFNYVSRGEESLHNSRNLNLPYQPL